MPIPLLALAAISAAPDIIQGGAQIIDSFSGKKEREQRERDAQAAFERSRQQYANQDITNVYEDITVNTQQADFQAAQARQSGADTMANFRAAAGGSGIASLATAIAANQANTAQKISGQIGEQEAKNQQLIASGELERQKRQSDLDATLLGMDMGELQGAREANQAARRQMVEGFGNIAGGVASGAATYIGGMDDLTPPIPEPKTTPTPTPTPVNLTKAQEDAQEDAIKAFNLINPLGRY